jgi:hypothetical protein
MSQSQNKLSKLQRHILLDALEGYYLAKKRSDNRALARAQADRRLALKASPDALEVIWTPRRGGILFAGRDANLNLDNPPHLSRKRILESFYGFWTRETPTEVIDRAREGAKRYNSANASVYRAIRRLETRGLIRRMEGDGTQLQLTDSGIQTAQALALLEHT